MSELVGTDTAAYGDPGEVLDRTAREAYRRRLGDLDADLAEAESNNDLGRAERVRIERDFLVAELSAAVGLGGRIRRSGDSTERARKAVAGRIKQAIDRIAGEAPALGRHLRNSVKTGDVLLVSTRATRRLAILIARSGNARSHLAPFGKRPREATMTHQPSNPPSRARSTRNGSARSPVA